MLSLKKTWSAFPSSARTMIARALETDTYEAKVVNKVHEAYIGLIIR